MKPAIYISALLPVIAAALAPAAQASSGDRTVCSHGNQTRIIEVKYTGEGQIPCEVHYTKDSGSQVLWSAQTEGGYCEQKAAEFVEKQRGWGWECETSMAAADSSEEAMSSNEEMTSDADMGSEMPQQAAEEAQPENSGMQQEETAATAE